MDSAPTEPGPAADDGVLQRVRRRTARAVALPAAVGVALALIGWGWPGWFVGVAGGVIGASAVTLCAAGTAVLARRSRLWSVAAGVARGWDPAAGVAVPGGSGDAGARRAAPAWAEATCAAPRPLYRPARSAVWRRARRYPAHVLALRAAWGALAAGEAMTVHGRPDGLLPAGGDRLLVYAVSARGPVLIGRPADGALFVADRWAFTAT